MKMLKKFERGRVLSSPKITKANNAALPVIGRSWGEILSIPPRYSAYCDNGGVKLPRRKTLDAWRKKLNY
jgi:hypothetical protein